MGCTQGKQKEKQNLDEIIRLYESKLKVLNAKIVKLEREKLIIINLYNDESIDDVFETNKFIF